MKIFLLCFFGFLALPLYWLRLCPLLPMGAYPVIQEWFVLVIREVMRRLILSGRLSVEKENVAKIALARFIVRAFREEALLLIR